MLSDTGIETLFKEKQEISKSYNLSLLCICYNIFNFVFLDDAKLRGLAAPSNLSMNQTLEGHSGESCTFKII